MAMGGCNRLADPPDPPRHKPVFQDLYAALNDLPGTQGHEDHAEPKVTLSVQAMPLGTFLRYLSDKTGVSVVCQADLDAQAVTLDVVDTPVTQVVGVIARRLGVSASRTGNVYFLGVSRPEDRGVLVRKVHRLSKTDLAAALLTLQSQNGRSATFDDGLVVVGDTVEVLQRVNELLDGIDNAPSSSWVIQLEILSFDVSKTRDLGLDITPAADLTLKLAQVAAQPASAVATVTNGVHGGEALNLSINAVFQAARENRDVRMEAEPLLLVVDGETATISKGVQVPIVQNAVSPYGTTTVQSVTYKPTGLQASVTMRDLGSSQGLLKLHFELDDVVGTAIQGYPNLANQSLDTLTALRSGGLYLVGSLNRRDNNHDVVGGLASHATDSSEGQVLQVWVRAYQIGPSLPNR
jgi:type II secretory pathway component GspD/PulD (secretin)